MDMIAWVVFLAASFIFATMIAVIIKLVLGKYLAFLIPIPLIFLIALITLGLIAAQAAGLPVSALYAAFFSWLAGLFEQSATAGAIA